MSVTHPHKRRRPRGHRMDQAKNVGHPRNAARPYTRAGYVPTEKRRPARKRAAR